MSEPEQTEHHGGGNRKGRRASFGNVRKLPSGRFQARYTGPDGRTHRAPVTFETKGDAETWLSMQRADITRRVWAPVIVDHGAHYSPTLEEFAARWMAERTNHDGEHLKPRTKSHYRKLLDQHVLPNLGHLTVRDLDVDDVRRWYAGMDPSKKTTRAHCYVLLRSIMASAADPDEYALRRDNPVKVRNAPTKARTARRVEPATPDELEAIMEHLPQRYRCMVIMSSWVGLRFGEVTELRRKDIDLKRAVVKVRRGVVRAGGQTVVGTPKSHAGIRDVDIPPHVLDRVRDHLDAMQDKAPDALLFPARDGATHMSPSALYRVYYPAREAAGRPDLRWHDLRHTGAVRAAEAGATVAELKERFGWSTDQAAQVYQHVAKGRGRQIAAAMSQMSEGVDTP